MTPSPAGSPTPRHVLVTGAAGYVGSRLIPRLLADGHRVRAGFQDAADAQRFWWAGDVEAVSMDVLEADQVRAAMEGIDAVYYLIHGLGGDDFMVKDREGAQNMAAAATQAGVGRFVYLTGIVPPVPTAELSDHIASRVEVEEILTRSGIPTIALRAAILMGSSSTSFEIVRQVSERLPLQTVPSWMDSQVQPIAVVDALEVLVAALERPAASRSYDIGGPDRMPYPQLLDTYAEVAGLTRPQASVPLLPSSLVGRLTTLFTDVPAPTVTSLIESLKHDMVCAETDFRTDLLDPGYELMGTRESIERALRQQTTDDPREMDPMGALPTDPTWAGDSPDEDDQDDDA